jgi:NADH:ubiquinone oxidoreductase subunit E
MEIKICVGSSCHLKGAPEVIAEFEETIRNHQIKDTTIELGACFCQECCQEGVIVLINGQKHLRVTPDMVKSLLAEGADHVN